MSEQPKRYSRRLKTKPVEIENEQGVVEVWTLKELTGADRNRFLNVQGKKIKTQNGVEVKDYTGLCSDLLCLCLVSPHDKLVTAAEVDSWPSEMQMDIFKDAISLSGLDKKSEDETKNG